MIRYILLILCMVFSAAFAIEEDRNEKNTKDFHVEHPDHIPHGHEKNPIKKVSHDDGIIPRKRKKLRVA